MSTATAYRIDPNAVALGYHKFRLTPCSGWYHCLPMEEQGEAVCPLTLLALQAGAKTADVQREAKDHDDGDEGPAWERAIMKALKVTQEFVASFTSGFDGEPFASNRDRVAYENGKAVRERLITDGLLRD